LNRSTDWRRRCALFRSSARADPCQAPAIMDGGCGLLSKQRSFSTLAHSRIFPSVREDFLFFGKIGGLNPKKGFLTRAGANNRYNASGEIFLKRTINGGLFFPHSRIQVSFPARTGCRPELCCGSGLLRWLGAISSCNQLFRDKPKAHSACHKISFFVTLRRSLCCGGNARGRLWHQHR